MPTSVHIPDQLLKRADERAKSLGISRNRLIVRALERELQQKSEWSPEFFQQLENTDPEMARAVDEMMEAVRANRRSKHPPEF